MSNEELKLEATELNISFRSDISAEKLAAKIDDFYKASESQSTVILTPESEETKDADDEAALKVTNTTNFQVYVQKARKDAEKTHIVTLIDNDSRVNNQTTTLTVSASNQYFDLGTVILPLNERVEVRQGHLNVIQELKIPQHVKNPKDPSISMMVMRPRYTVQFEQPQE